jgi:hypothetical protein
MKNVPSADEWGIFAEWHEPASARDGRYSWGTTEELVAAHRKYEHAIQEVIESRLAGWDQDLAEFGGDPMRRDWTGFRPLRLSREEDWSDWLAFLIEISTTGVSASQLFGETGSVPGAYSRPAKVDREVIAQPYRADLLVRWTGGGVTHVEIKIGDPNLEKTFETADRLQEKYGHGCRRWIDFILLLPVQRSDWDSLVDRIDVNRHVGCITWQDVSIGLRRGLLSDESVIWKSFALAFVGAIEQTLLRFPGPSHRGGRMGTVEQQLHVLEEGKYHG